MKKIFILFILITSTMSLYSGYWQIDMRRLVYTGGFSSDWGGAVAYGDSIFYFMEKPMYEDTIKNKTYPGSISWRTLDAGKTFNPFVGHITNCPWYECPDILDTKSLISHNRKIVMLDKGLMYWVGINNSFFKTTDAGESWTLVKFFTHQEYDRRDFVDFDMESNGFGAFMYNSINASQPDEYIEIEDSIVISTDDWKTAKWAKVSNTIKDLIPVSLCIADTTTIYANMRKWNNSEKMSWSVICKSTDKGENWENIEMGKKYFHTIHFINKDTGWAGGYGYDATNGQYPTVIYKTTDGAKTWKKQLSATHKHNGIMKILFGSEKDGFALGYSDLDENIPDSTDVIVYHTKDGGENWVREKPDSLNYKIGFAFDLAVGSPQNAYIIVGWFLFKYIPDEDLGITEEALPPMPEELKFYPNPIAKTETGILDLGNTYGETISNVCLYNYSGTQINDNLKYSLDKDNKLSFNLSSGISSGTYILAIQLGINRIKYCKIVVK